MVMQAASFLSFISLTVAIIVGWFILIVGWSLNLIWLVMSNGESGTEFYVALAGTVVVPLGAVHGFLTVF